MSETVITAIISAITAVIGSILSYLATRKTKREKDEIKGATKKGRYFRNIVVISTIIIVGASIGVVYSYFVKPLVPPFKAVRNFSFEDSTIRPWKIDDRDLEITDDLAHSGEKSLRLQVDSEPGTQNNIYLDIDSPNETLGLASCEAYVFIPSTEQVKDGELCGRISGLTFDENENLIYIYGETVEINNGEWTRLTCSFSYKTQSYDPKKGESIDIQSSDWKIHHLYIMVWSPNESYRGSIYYDDIVLYEWRQ